MVNASARGKAGEDLALRYLLTQGLRLHTRNFRCRCGEIDLIMLHDTTLVFVEVRVRAAHDFGDGATSVTALKQQKIIRAAQWFLQQQQTLPACRFDVISISQGKICWIRDAFWVE